MAPHELNVVSRNIVSEVLHDPLRHVDPAASNTKLVARSMRCEMTAAHAAQCDRTPQCQYPCCQIGGVDEVSCTCRGFVQRRYGRLEQPQKELRSRSRDGLVMPSRPPFHVSGVSSRGILGMCMRTWLPSSGLCSLT